MDDRAPAFALAGALFLADRASKWIIQDRISPWQTVTVIPGFFNLVHTRNPGAAFSLLAAADPGWRTLLLLGLSLAAVLLVSLLLWRPGGAGRALRRPLALILGGALGNLYDRLLYGEVTDFLEFYLGRFRWPAFNLADSAITIGAILVALDLWRSREPAGSP
jgi:signal peptidase II